MPHRQEVSRLLDSEKSPQLAIRHHLLNRRPLNGYGTEPVAGAWLVDPDDAFDLGGGEFAGSELEAEFVSGLLGVF